MTTVAFIPARGGSERIPAKNLAEIDGLPLVRIATRCARDAFVDRVVVSTDDAEIADHARADGMLRRAEIHDRPAEFAGPHAQIEDAIAHWLEGDGAGLAADDVIVLLQPTSPFRTPETVRRCVEAARECGSALTVHRDPGAVFGGEMIDVRGRRVVDWDRTYDEVCDPRARPRSQDLAAFVREDGCCYAFTFAHFRKTRCRMGYDSAPVLIDRWEALDIDTPEDLEVARAIAAAGLR